MQEILRNWPGSFTFKLSTSFLLRSRGKGSGSFYSHWHILEGYAAVAVASCIKCRPAHQTIYSKLYSSVSRSLIYFPLVRRVRKNEGFLSSYCSPEESNRAWLER